MIEQEIRARGANVGPRITPADIEANIASERAMRIARVAAEELVRSQGEHTNTADEFLIPACQADDHMRDCIAHLVWTGEAVFHEREDGYMVVRLERA